MALRIIGIIRIIKIFAGRGKVLHDTRYDVRNRFRQQVIDKLLLTTVMSTHAV